MSKKQIQIILCMRKVSSGPLLSIHTFCKMILLVDSEGPDHLHNLIWAFAICTWSEGTFSLGRAHFLCNISKTEQVSRESCIPLVNTISKANAKCRSMTLTSRPLRGLEHASMKSLDEIVTSVRSYNLLETFTQHFNQSVNRQMDRLRDRLQKNVHYLA